MVTDPKDPRFSFWFRELFGKDDGLLIKFSNQDIRRMLNLHIAPITSASISSNSSQDFGLGSAAVVGDGTTIKQMYDSRIYLVNASTTESIDWKL